MKKVSVINKAKRVIIINKNVLIPGVNLVDEKKFTSIKKDVENHGELETKGEKGQDASNICEFNIKDAEALVVECYDQDILDDWMKQEADGKKRPKILDLMEKQEEKIEEVLLKKDEK